MKKPIDSGPYRFYLGDDYSTEFHPGDGALVYGNRLNGSSFYQNGQSVDILNDDFTYDYEVINVLTGSNHEASQIGGDRGTSNFEGYTSQMWVGDIAEVIIFNKVISDSERIDINFYLAENGDSHQQLIVMVIVTR